MIFAKAYLNPNPEVDGYILPGSWKKMEEIIDYEINQLQGYIRINTTVSAVAIAYTIADYNQNTAEFIDSDYNTHTDFNEKYINC